MQKTHIVTLLFLALVLSCAHQLSPSGGPSDTSSPEITMSIPRDGALNVDTNSRITIIFSEWISKKDIKVVSIFPPLKHKLTIDKNRIEIIPQQPLNNSQTYHVVLSSKLSDLHGNAFKSSFSLVFSTGKSLDSGTVSGCVVDPSQKNKTYEISLFGTNSFRDSGYTGTPSYKIETDSTGTFSLNFLKMGKYRIAGFPLMSNATQKGSRSLAFIPEDSLITVTSNSTNVKLYTATIDTAFPIISTIKTDNRAFAVCTWTKPVDTAIFQVSLQLSPADSPTVRTQFTQVKYGSTDRFAILPQKQFSIAQWHIIYSVSRTFDTVIFRDTMTFNSTDKPDTTRPSLKPVPSLVNHFIKQDIALPWSEPCKITEPLFIADSLGDTVNLIYNNAYNDTTVCTLAHTLKPGSIYKLKLLKKFGQDLAGNFIATKDSTDTVSTISFSTILSDSIAVSIQGNSSCDFLNNRASKKWIFSPFGKKDIFTTISKSDTFYFDTLPSGTGSIGMFIDKNNNNKPDPGTLIPWKSPEPYYTFSDTVEARPRWEVDGISLKGCLQCGK